jgi:hypothetical protein
MAINGNDTILVLAKEVEGKTVTSVNCTKTQLMGVIMHLVDAFAEAAETTYNGVLADLHDKNEQIQGQ